MTLRSFAWSCFRNNTDTKPERRQGRYHELLVDLSRDIETGIGFVMPDPPIVGPKKKKVNAAKNGALLSGASYLSGTTRCDDTVQMLSFLTYDFDALTPQQYETITTAWGVYDSIWYETFQSSPEIPRLRCILLTSRDMTPTEYKQVWRDYADIALSYGAAVDESCANISRAFYTARRGRAPCYVDGQTIDVDSHLRNFSKLSRVKQIALADVRPDIGQKIKGGDGTSNDAFSFAGVLRARGLPRDERWQLLRTYSNQRHEPPITDDEVTRVTDGIERYAEQARLKLSEIPIGADIKELADRGIELLVGTDIYERGQYLVRVIAHRKKGKDGIDTDGVARPDGALTIGRVPLASLKEELSARARWMKTLANGHHKDAGPPDDAVAAIAARGAWPDLPTLHGITEVPLIRPDGSLLDTPGYDAATGLVYAPRHGGLPDIPEHPTDDDIKDSVAILHHVVCDYPFQDEGHRAAWVAWLLTGFGRLLVDGPMPALLIDSPTRGSGKTMLAELAGIILTGTTPPKTAPSKEDAEMRKRITSLAMAGDRIVILDNVEGAIGGSALDTALTARTWSDRVLGDNNMPTLRLDMQWAITGNQVVLAGDLIRRVLYCRLCPECEHPEARTGFAHTDLKQWVTDNRETLIAACLTILRGYCAAGKPLTQVANWGSFDSWVRFIGHATAWAGGIAGNENTDPLAQCADNETVYRHGVPTAEEVQARRAADPTGSRALLAHCDNTSSDEVALLSEMARFYPNGCTAGMLCQDFAQSTDRKDLLTAIVYSKSGQFPTSREVSYRLLKMRDRVIRGMVLRSLANSDGLVRWSVKQISSDSIA